MQSPKKFDVIFTCEEKVYDQVYEWELNSVLHSAVFGLIYLNVEVSIELSSSKGWSIDDESLDDERKMCKHQLSFNRWRHRK